MSSRTAPSPIPPQRSASPTSVGMDKLPVKHKVLAADAHLTVALQQERLAAQASGRAPPAIAGNLANAHRAPTPAVIRGPRDDMPNAGGSSLPSPSLPLAAASHGGSTWAKTPKVTPARHRASPALLESGGSNISRADLRAALARPPSAGGSSLPPLVDGPDGRSFADELLEIAALRFGPDAARRREQHSEASRGPSVLGFSAKRSTSRTDNNNASTLTGSRRATDSTAQGEADGSLDTADPTADATTTATGKPLHMPYSPDIRAHLSHGAAPHTHVAPAPPMSLSDYRMLAQACQRAGRARTECHAYYKIAEILSSQRETMPKAVPYLQRYLSLCRRLSDLQGEAKALNSLGILHHRLGGASNLQLAVQFHQQHAEIADAAGIFIAQTNLGLLHRALGDAGMSLECLKQALQYAVRAGDRQAEALALANLGLSGTAVGDFSTARVCVERQLELSTALKDTTGSCEAYENLGGLAMQRGDAQAAHEHFVMALDLALRQEDQATARRVRCQIGMVESLAKAESVMQAASERMKGGGA